jgi:hypothetical protein
VRRRYLTERHLDKEYLALSIQRVVSTALSGKRLTPLSEIMEEAGITQEQLDGLPDVEIDCRPRRTQHTTRRLRRGGCRRIHRLTATHRRCTSGDRLAQK